MKSLYVSQQGCYVCLQGETLLVKQKQQILATAQIPLVEQILVFGKSQVTTQAIHACIQQNIPIVYLSRLGYCYGRILPITSGYRQLSRHQQQLTYEEKLTTAKAIVAGKLHNSRVLLQRQQRQKNLEILTEAIAHLKYLIDRVKSGDRLEKLFGFEGAGANAYFKAFGQIITNPAFVFAGRSRRPPGNPVNAMLSFGYQVLWNHLLALIEVQGLDPYQACLHQGTERHAALASDLIEEFRSPIVDSLVLYLINRHMINEQDFEFYQGGCYLNSTGRKKYLQAFLKRMESQVKTNDSIKQPQWDILSQQIKSYKQFVYNPIGQYQPYSIR